MDEAVFQSRLKVGIGDSDLWKLRKKTAFLTTQAFSLVGQALRSRTDLTNDDSEAILAMGTLLQMAGELGFAASRMLSGKEHYAGCALLRQIVEIEYLTWTFKEGHGSVTDWLNSTHEERMRVFSPRQLRSNSKGRFLFKDYQDHCEQGGHPVPRGIPLLGGQEIGMAQVMLVDLLTHCWRTWDQVCQWFIKLDNAHEIGFPSAGAKISYWFNEWGTQDPIYALMIESKPDPATDQQSR